MHRLPGSLPEAPADAGTTLLEPERNGDGRDVSSEERPRILAKEQRPSAAPSRTRITAVVPATDDPLTLTRCIQSVHAAVEGPEELIVVQVPAGSGPATARNVGSADASGDVLAFLDSDVEVHPDAFRRIRRTFEVDPRVTAVFGSYDDAPEGKGVVSTFRNLLHHYVHQSAAGEDATTFWAGLGAVRRDAFIAIDGFDGERFRKSSVEDIDFGMRLRAAGAKIVLDPELQGRHLKIWTFRAMVRTDFARRGVPWIRILLDSRTSSTALNLAWRHRISAAASVLLALALPARRPALAAASATTLVALNHPFYRLLARTRGVFGAVSGVALHAVHHLAAVASVPVGVEEYVVSRLRRRDPS
jgi:hypothetical protein